MVTGERLGVIELGGHRFEVANLRNQRLVRFISYVSKGFRGREPLAAEFTGLSAEGISRTRYARFSDGYYYFTRLTADFLINGQPVQVVDHETHQSPTTYFGGRIVVLSSLKEDGVFVKMARDHIKDGYERAVIMDCSPERPYRSAMYPLNPDDCIIARPQ